MRAPFANLELVYADNLLGSDGLMQAETGETCHKQRK